MAEQAVTITVPACDAACLVGDGLVRYGVLSATKAMKDYHDIVVTAFPEWHEVLTNIRDNMQQPGVGPVEFCQRLPQRLRWYQWAHAVQAGDVLGETREDDKKAAS